MVIHCDYSGAQFGAMTGVVEMSEKDRSGPAFPFLVPNESGEDVVGFKGEIIPDGVTTAYRGITIRDYFAAKAMVGIIGNEEMVQRHRVAAQENSIGEEVLLATSAFMLADAMLAERAK